MRSGCEGGGESGGKGGDVIYVSLTASLGVEAQLNYATLPLHSPLPAAVSTATGRRILLPDRAAALAYGHGMEEAIASTGCQAWAILPLSTPAAAPDKAGTGFLAERRGYVTMNPYIGDPPAWGALAVGWRGGQTFTPAVLEVLDAFATHCAQALARLHVRADEQTRAEQTFQLAQVLQRSMLSEPAHPDGLQVVTRYRPAVRQAEVGGDWYDSFVTASGVTTLVVGDVCGHDRVAAAAMGQVRSMLRAIAYTIPQDPATILTLLDHALQGLHVDALTTTVVLAVEQDAALATAGRHRLRWSNAGHLPPLLIHPDGWAELLRTDAELLVGLDPGTSRTTHVVEVDAGSTVLLYTDGLVERRDASAEGIDDGLAWLVRTASALAGAGLDEVCDTLLQQVEQDLEDDVVLLALRV